MATASTLTTIRQRIGSELGIFTLIPNGFLTAFAAGSVTSPNFLQNTRFSTTEFSSKQTIIFRPGAASSADYERYAGDLTNTSGLLAHTGANYADTTVGTETVELWRYGVRPTVDIVNAINRALEFMEYTTWVALSHLGDLDGDMAATTDTNWTDVGTPTTSAKSTTARRTPYGLRSYNLIGDAVDEGTQSATLGITQGRPISAFTIGSANSGTLSFQPYDVTNSVAIGTAVTHSEEEPQLMAFRNQSVPATCKEVATRHLGTVNPTDAFWNMAWLYKLDNLRVNLPSYVTEKFQAPNIYQGIPKQQNGTDYWDAGSIEMNPLIKGRDYHLVINQPDANPSAVVFENASAFDWPLFVEARIPYSNLTTFATTESTTTTAPLHLLVPMAKIELLTSYLIPKFPNDAKWAFLLQQARQELQGANIVRPVEPSARVKERWGGFTRV